MTVREDKRIPIITDGWRKIDERDPEGFRAICKFVFRSHLTVKCKDIQRYYNQVRISGSHHLFLRVGTTARLPVRVPVLVLYYYIFYPYWVLSTYCCTYEYIPLYIRVYEYHYGYSTGIYVQKRCSNLTCTCTCTSTRIPSILSLRIIQNRQMPVRSR